MRAHSNCYTTAKLAPWIAMNIRVPLLLFACLYLALITTLLLTGDRLPENVATHFNASGQPDGWMSRANHLLFFALFGLLFPGFVVGLCSITRFVPPSMINLPNRDYWTAPERISETHHRILRHSLWFASLAVAFVVGLYISILEANSHPRPELSLSLLLPITGAFLVGVLIWSLTLILPFRRAPGSLTGKQPSAAGAKFH